METTEKIKFKEFLRLTIWLVKQELAIAPATFIIYVLIAIANNLLPIFETFIAAQLINETLHIISNGSGAFSTTMFLLGGLLFSLYLLTPLAYDLFQYCEYKITYTWDWKMWSRYIAKLAEHDLSHTESQEYNLLMHKTMEALDWRGRSFLTSFVYMIGSFFGLLLIAGIFLSVNIVFIAAVIIPSIFSFLINKKFGTNLYNFWEHNGEVKIHGWYARDIFEKKDVVLESKIYGFKDYIVKKYTDTQKEFITDTLGKLKKKYLSLSAVRVANAGIFVSIQFLLLDSVLKGVMKIGDYSFYIASLITISNSFSEIENKLSNMMAQIRYVKDLKTFMELPQVIVIKENASLVKNESPEIEFRNVSFSYPRSTTKILNNLSFKIKAGEKVALVGQNGAGKSTLIKLLARFYDVTEGEILINGVNIKDLDLESYYKLWGVLFQSFAKLWLTVQENIGLGSIEDMDKMNLIEDAAKKADATEFINKLPNAYQTYLTLDLKNGTELSGGQWQKLGIARSMFANPKLIIMDEPTSALDALAEAEVFSQINHLAKDITVLIVSHRFATVRQADKIIVLENGQITEQGSHEELITKKGLYCEMFTSQAEGYK
jgi:ATP-binding cassette subfamily B protein